jgi:hypothetical protein
MAEGPSDRVETLSHQAADLLPEEQRALLDAACRLDPTFDWDRIVEGRLISRSPLPVNGVIGFCWPAGHAGLGRGSRLPHGEFFILESKACGFSATAQAAQAAA